MHFYHKLRVDITMSIGHPATLANLSRNFLGQYLQHVAHLIGDGGGNGVVDLEGFTK